MHALDVRQNTVTAHTLSRMYLNLAQLPAGGVTETWNCQGRLGRYAAGCGT